VQVSFLGLLFLILLTVPLPAQDDDYRGSYAVPLLTEALRYDRKPAANPVSRLIHEIESGKASLAWDVRHGYLPAILKALDVPVSSQALVFSKTSLQLHRISPDSPRAIYFNDDVYVGWVPRGDVVEISAADSALGGVFFSLRQEKSAKPAIERGDQCLQCHHSGQTTGVPGHLVRSVYPDSDGYPITTTSSFVTDHRTPFLQRWGGWYVTGSHGSLRHMGNSVAKDVNKPEALDREKAANLSSIANRFDISRYLSPHSDIVALMVLEHQTKMHNIITRAGFEARSALLLDAEMKKTLGETGKELGDSTKRRIERAATVLVHHLLFAGEIALPTPIRGTSSFASEFAPRAPRDPRGRSLRELDLKTRLFKYPCSFLIYSEAFSSLPAPLLAATRRRLDAILFGADTAAAFSHLTPDDRRNIREILAATLR